MKIVILFAFICNVALAAHIYPEYLKQYRCKASSENFSDCFLNKLRNTLPYYVKGIPELDIPPFDPFMLPLYSRNVNILGNKISATFKNSIVTGLRNTIIHNAKVDLKKNYAEISVTIPWLDMATEYDISGEFFSYPIDVKGTFKGNITEIQLFSKSTLQTYKKDGEDYYKFDKINQKIQIGGGRIEITATDKELMPIVQTIAEYFNEHPRGFFNLILPFTLEYAQDLLREFGDEYLANLPASEWLPQ
ncbi:unnamed protein product [Diabrotica balteata]|uniref:Uncharacterized protein n=1 Tax=Diabrotica balteata TaxID=107213 RepID=A0A9N9T5W5_DIABA|nr:unnamed protein product [Diabrotica balteata]